jgi:LPXTG-motif cell wall-anchored protein
MEEQMKRKAIFVLLIVCAFSLGATIPAAAYFTNVTGELLLDPSSTEPWTLGATLQVFYHCNSTPVLQVTEVLPAGDSTFDIPLPAPTGATRMCVTVDFNEGPGGDPPSQQSAEISNSLDASGAYGPLVFYSNTGPAAVTLQQLSATAGSGSPLLLAAGVMLLGALSLVAVRRSRV